MKRGENVDIVGLVKKAKQGDKDALVELIMDQKSDFYKLAYVYMKNSEDAMDAMEDMIVILYENIHRLKKEEAFYSWSKTILVNCCKSVLRKRRHTEEVDDFSEETSEKDIRQKEDQIVLERCLSQLDEKHQDVIRLRYFLDLDYKSIADIVKVPLGTVKSRISIGLKKLKESLGGEEYERS
jgi:RNA polymerase sigma factor (sigma-70 family)